MRAAEGQAVLRHGDSEDVCLVEDLSEKRAAILRRYLEPAVGARPFFPSDAVRRSRNSKVSSASIPSFG